MQVFLLFGKERRYTWRMQRIQELGDHPQWDEIERRYRESGGRLDSLAPRSRKPKRSRPPQTNARIEEYIRQYRIKHPGVGKSAIKSPLDAFCQRNGMPTVSESTVGRVISRLKKQGRLPGPRLGGHVRQ
jgi:hypothetical protein